MIFYTVYKSYELIDLKHSSLKSIQKKPLYSVSNEKSKRLLKSTSFFDFSLLMFNYL